MIQPKRFAQFPELVLAFSEQSDGNMGRIKAAVANEAELILPNRQRFVERLGIDLGDVVQSQQRHSDRVAVVHYDHKGLTPRHQSPFELADALVTDQSDLYLAIFVADCLPIFLYDPEQGMVGAIHAGWRGLADGIIGKTMAEFVKLGGDPAKTQVWIGPHIKECHYRLDLESPSYQEKIAAMGEIEGLVVERDGQQFLDLTLWAVRQLEEQGIDSSRMEIADCTACSSERYYSYYQSRGRLAGLMMGIIGVKRGISQ